MSIHIKLSRITKTFTDVLDIEFQEAEKRLTLAKISIIADEKSRTSAAGQAALLTALVTSKKIFKHVTLVTDKDVVLKRPLPGANTLVAAAKFYGAEHSPSASDGSTHVITTNSEKVQDAFVVKCWWDRWCAGVLPTWDDRTIGEGWNPLAGTFSGALAVREIFSNVLGRRVNNPKKSIISIWEPWNDFEEADRGPEDIYLPRNLWVVGLGHLGQGFLWSLGLVPGHGEKLVLQDYQSAGIENEATGLVTSSLSVGRRKTRVGADWVEHFGWETELIERKITRNTEITLDDPPLIISGLDNPQTRIETLEIGFPHMIDAGVGHGPFDFESAQIRVFAKGDESTWTHGEQKIKTESLLDKPAYKGIDRCGAFQLAEASVAVPFVGAAVGALTLSQALRLTAVQLTPSLFQIELSAPHCNSSIPLCKKVETNFGGVPLNLRTGEFNL